MTKELNTRIIVVGAGPAGLACAHTLAEAGNKSLVFDENVTVGGMCRTINFHGYLFDIGGHRFLTTHEPVLRLWREILKDDSCHVERLSRIYFRNTYFKYPLSFFDTLLRLGPIESIKCLCSYLRSSCAQSPEPISFEDWIINRFGKRLYLLFFKTYTEKVWGIPCAALSADWAAQRIEGLSLSAALKNALFRKNSNAPKTLYETFIYPRTGPGAFCEGLKAHSEQNGVDYLMKRRITKVFHNHTHITGIAVNDLYREQQGVYDLGHLFSTIPLPKLISLLQPAPPEAVMRAAETLRFRSFLVVNVILNKQAYFPDQWIYIHSPKVRLGRIQNYKNWSPAMVIDPSKTTLGLEYFCNENDALWNMNDIDLINYAVDELEKIGMPAHRYLINGFVIRAQNAYPIYDINYHDALKTVQDYIKQFSNLKSLGRAGRFRYCNSDVALLDGMTSAERFLREKDSLPCNRPPSITETKEFAE